jgi:hypothetical protein
MRNVLNLASGSLDEKSCAYAHSISSKYSAGSSLSSFSPLKDLIFVPPILVVALMRLGIGDLGPGWLRS